MAFSLFRSRFRSRSRVTSRCQLPIRHRANKCVRRVICCRLLHSFQAAAARVGAIGWLVLVAVAVAVAAVEVVAALVVVVMLAVVVVAGVVIVAVFVAVVLMLAVVLTAMWQPCSGANAQIPLYRVG